VNEGTHLAVNPPGSVSGVIEPGPRFGVALANGFEERLLNDFAVERTVPNRVLVVAEKTVVIEDGRPTSRRVDSGRFGVVVSGPR